jgi:AGCS family alanine or glycine:cation symporter
MNPNLIAASTLERFADSMTGWVWSIPLFFLLLGCGLVFSVITKLVQVRILSHGYACIRGHYDNPDDAGHINHFQALCAALSATIGLGNIAGVALAISLGGPGAIFWMWVVGVFGMALKFVECSLAVMFRDTRDVPDPSAPALVRADAEDRTLEYAGQEPPAAGATPRARGEVRGGPMWYMQKALVEPLKKRGNPLWVCFKILAVLFAVSTVLNSFGSGNMFQGWNVADMLHKHFEVPQTFSAVIVSSLVALVIIGGITRIGQVASKLVPLMCVVYVAGALLVIMMHASEVPGYLALIVKSAFTPMAEGGACAGITVWLAFTHGLKRACFSNEAGEGSAAIAHAAAKTDEPIREGIVAGIGPFIDTILICTMSALVLLMSGTWNRPEVGTITALDEERAVIECRAEVPENLESLYLELVQKDKAKLRVHLNRGTGEELEDLILPIDHIEMTEGEGWAGVATITLDPSRADEDDLDKVAQLAVGQPAHVDIEGADMTAFAFDTTISGFGKYIITLAVCLFGFSTMISWSYYGEKGAEYLLGPRAILPYKFLFVVFVFLGMVLTRFETVYKLSDATVGLMVFCNLPAILILSPTVVRAARDYFRRLDSGEMPRRGK